MQLTVQGKQMDVGDALRTHVGEKLEDINSKYFNRAIDATVSFSKEGHGHGQFRCQISIRVGRNIMVVAENETSDPYASFDVAADKIAKQLRRYKRKLRDHHERQEQSPEAEILKARDFLLASSPETDENDSDGVPLGDDPAIIAETAKNIETLSVSDAVMRMDLAGENALLFRNAKHSGLNLVYRRPDGNVGWVDLAETA
ncbi:MAG: ribosome-associated translation inhibitor RaiA [Alphaproteobacteria bacterium]|nr:ribosome-associated translation inhibitor RaiA [Alphaproteobacteria bacterium]